MTDKWEPEVGDLVRIKGDGNSGRVFRIASLTRRYVLSDPFAARGFRLREKKHLPADVDYVTYCLAKAKGLHPAGAATRPHKDRALMLRFEIERAEQP